MMAAMHKRSAMALSFSCLRNSPTAAARSKQSGATIGKMRSIRFEGTQDMTSNPPRLQARSQNVSGDIVRNAARMVGRDSVEPSDLPFSAMIGNAISSKLQGASRCSRWGR
jgi:hypothetical protein